MLGVNRAPFIANQDIQITLDLPMPTSTNRIWRVARNRIIKSAEYIAWQEAADMTVMAAKAYPRQKITGPYEMELLLNATYRGDGSNRIKACEDWLQSRDIVRNDADCQHGSWAWVEPEQAPRGCRVILRSL